jgi:7-cyano-7-deazaguanine synthase in queuosine biosynthesis
MFTKSKFPAILLFSGGVDSFVAWYWLGKPQTVYFDLKTKCAEKEKKFVQEIRPNIIIDQTLDLHAREIGQNAYVPFRNLLIASQAAWYSDIIYIIGLKDDKVLDKNEAAFNAISHTLSKLEGRPIKVLSPFWNMTKANVVKWYLENVNSNPEQLLKTVSCYSNESTNYCGFCPSCFRKWNAFRANGIDIKFYNDDLMEDYYQRAKAEEYIPERNESIIREIDAYRS